jgi:diguanylate cyclase (GGDEF)-like protein
LETFDPAVWGPALEKYGAVTQLSVALYGADGQMVAPAVPATPLVTLFEAHGYDPGIVQTCAHRCLEQTVDSRPPVVVEAAALAVVGVALRLDGSVVGAAVAGYALGSFPDSVSVARLARASNAPFTELWGLFRRQQPLPVRRLILHGELLQVLGDTLLRENDLRRRSERVGSQLSHLASHDPLTDLPNRLLLADRLSSALSHAQRYQRQLAVLFLDIDHFKHINDSLGHLVGDELLRSVSRQLSQCVRSSDTVGRIGGDEFVVVMSELSHKEDAARGAQKILASLAKPHTVLHHSLHVTASIGISVYPDDGGDAERLLSRADMALYHAKELGRESYQFFKPELNLRAVERHWIEAGLHQALDNGQFELVYQPKLNLRTGALVGAEALIRWRHPDRGLIGPAEFVPIAEECGLIRPIGQWVLREACQQARAWQDTGLAPIPVSVNISVAEFRAKRFLDNLANILNETRLAPNFLEIEVTESVLMAHAETTSDVLHELKTLGVQLAIDDFGTGWSSLSYLRLFQVDALKIDKSFVQEITSASSTAPIVSAVISMARSLDHRVVAEGIETRDQLAFLQAENCAEGQGYYFSRPVPADRFAEILATATATP